LAQSLNAQDHHLRGSKCLSQRGCGMNRYLLSETERVEK